MVKFVLIIAAVAAVVLAVVFFAQRRLIYFPDRGSEDLRESVPNAEEALFEADDGVHLHGWFVPGARARRDIALLFCHGNAGNAAHRAPVAGHLAALGLDVLVFDYRGYGRSDDAPPTEDGLYRDGRAALAWLQQRTGLPPERIVIHGESLGTGVAVQLASELEPRGPFALVLESPFTSLADTAASVYPWLPVRWLLRDRYDNLAKIASVRAPLLVIHGTRDDIVPVEEGRALYGRAALPKRLVELPGVGHGGLWVDAKVRRGQIAEFLDSIADPGGAAPR